MTISERDRRALLLLGFAVVGMLLYTWITDTSAPADGAVPGNPIEAREKRLERLRQLAAQVPGREEQYKQVSAQLAAREKRFLQADTAAQAQANLRQILARVARAQAPPVELRASEFGQLKPMGKEYGEVPVTVTLECPVEQLLNIVTELTAQPEVVAVNELRVYSANPKQKTMNVRMTVSAVVAKKLIPEKKGAAS